MIKKYAFILTILASTWSGVTAQSSIYGIYSNIDISKGEPSGFEMFFLGNGNPGKCNVTVMFQAAEGSPQYPELLDCCEFSNDHVAFVSKKWGRFTGKIQDGTLSGEFIDLKLKVTLKKGLSFWQKQ